MKNADKPTFPYRHSELLKENRGLTKREYFAAMAMQGLCANSNSGSQHSFDRLAKEAVMYADELLKQLEK